ncbi:7TM diverse intracellular signaling domain-containing protein [Polaromonas sp.]|uniref:7TM diverse intracellular signaling domain-containing protein n=1 Tax=Polaromonas sp. TaxID=1869339 RepID=UPI002FC58C25
MRTLLLLTAVALLSPPGLAQPVTTLDAQTPSIDLRAASLIWMDPTGQASIEQVASRKNAPSMAPAQGDAPYSLRAKTALWQHYRLLRPAGDKTSWVLEFPTPQLDLVTVFQRPPGGTWFSQTAGDTVAVASWPEPGRYARFQLELPAGEERDVYVRIQHATDIDIPINATTANSHNQRLQLEYLGIGVVLGALILLVAACTAQSWIYDDALYGWYAAYTIIIALAIAAYSGVAGHLLWRNFGAWADIAQGFLALLGASAALLFVHALCGKPRWRWFDASVHWTGLAGVPLAILYANLARPYGVQLVGVYLPLVVVLGIGTAYVAWRRSDVVGLWVLAAFTPLGLTTLLAMARIFGWISTNWASQYGVMVALTIGVPLLLVTLSIRSRERHGVEAREQAMASQDALTGLLAAHLFEDRLNQVVSRAKRHKEPAAVVFVDLVNYDYIKRTWGTAVAEQSLLRSVIKLRRVLRDVNTVGRIGEARFGLIMEGVSSRTPVTELAARLIAAGLMPLKGLQPEVILQFHVGGVLLNERLMDGPALSQALADLLDGMAARTRRPIRFLDPELTHPMPLEADSGLDDEADNND